MKEAQIFENWINNLSEGTWALPETPEQMEKLNQLMSAELIVGPDATNATELLNDIVGDADLFEILENLADNDPRANIWDDSDVQARLAELGIQTPQSTQAAPADVAQDTAPPVMEGPDGYEPIAHAIEQYITNHYNGKHGLDTDDFMKVAGMVRNGSINSARKFASTLDTDPRDKLLSMLGQGVAEGDNMSTFVEDAELAEMLKYAGVPIKESVLTDSTGSTLDHIQNTFKRDVKDFTQTGDMSDALYDALYDYYFDDMPYGTKKARDGDPHEWISDRFAQDIGLDEGWKGALAGGLAGAGLGSVVPGLGTLAGGIAGAYAGHKIGDQGISDPTPAAPGAAAPQRNAPIKMTAADRLAMPSGPRKASFQKPIAESSCNMTMEGSYCPEHGLAECGGMYEGTDDPINSNSAMTGSYYEGKETDIQAGDALLARIKSLALLR